MDKPIPETVVTDKLIADLLPPALIFAETGEHLSHARQRAKTILLETLTAAQQQGQEAHWKVGRFRSSHTPERAVLVLSVGAAIERDEQHHSFIEWVYAHPAETQAQGGGNCWSCGKLYTLKQRGDADGNCPSCGAEIELDAQQQQGQAVACGGCGNTDPEKVCVGCLHPFAAPQPMQQGGGEYPMTEAEVRQWIDACNHEPARQVLRDYLRLRTAPPSAPVGVDGLVAKWRGLANDALRRSGTWSGNDIADRIEFMADELEALAQQPAACTACNGRGEVGGATPGGFETHPCPECEQQSAAADEARVVETIRKALHHSYGAGHTNYANFTEALDYLATQHQEPTT